MLGSALRRVVLAVFALLLMSAVLGLAGEKADSEGEISWTSANPAVAPSPRVLHGMAYDSESDRVILFGGRLADANDDETWAYDFNSNTWTNMNPSVKPLARNYPTMAYDSESDRIVLFGGQTEGGLSGETWAYDYNTDTWTNMAPGAAPSPRSAAGVGYDAESDRIILFAGFLGGPGGTTFGDDTWAYDFNSNTWTKMSPATRPSPRGPSLAYDGESDRVIFFSDGGPVADDDETWAYDFNTDTWTNVNPATRPSDRGNHALAYDSESDQIILFGGVTLGGSGRSDETWTYDINSNTWRDVNPSSNPSKRWGHALAYDAESDRVVLFGGSVGLPFSDETWAYDFNANTWTDLSPTAPSAPLSLQATAGDAQVDLTWSPPSDDGGSPITGYRVWRGTVSGPIAFLIEIGNVQTYSDTGVTNDVTYDYAVAALNSRGVGPQSSQASATPTASPDTTSPTISIVSPLDGSSLASTSVTVTGTASDDIAVRKVELSTDATTWVLATGTTSWSAALTLAEGENTIFARVTDTSGNAATMSIAVTVVPPTPALQVSPLVLTVGIGAGVAVVAAVAALLILRRRGKRKGEG